MRLRSTFFNLLSLCFFQFTITTVFGHICTIVENDSWSYEGYTNGPPQWGRNFPTCNGTNQSPINIDTDDVESSNLEPLALVGYDQPITTARILNNGYRVEIYPSDEVNRYVEVNGEQYMLHMFHFHWNENPMDGTEHAFDGRRYSLEAHFMHHNMDDDDDIANVGILYEATSDPNPAFEPLVSIFPDIQYKDQEIDYQGSIDLSAFLPSNPASFYRYIGSLTTPPCTEGVTWSVLTTPQQIGTDQVSEFTNLYSVTEENATPDCRITRNTRPLQSINGRQVYESQ